MTMWVKRFCTAAVLLGGCSVYESGGSTQGQGSTVGDAATGANGDQADNSVIGAGAVYVFVRTNNTWSQQAYVKASNTATVRSFGEDIALSGDGDTLAVGAVGEASNATGIDGDQNNNSALTSGAVYVFKRAGALWAQQAYVKASNTGQNDHFGASVALNADGNTLAVSAIGEDSNAVGIGGSQGDNSAEDAGAVYVFKRVGAVWSQQAYVKASNSEYLDNFGTSVVLNAVGDTLAVGAFGEDSDAEGVGGDQANNARPSSGAVYVFKRAGELWSQQAYIKASTSDYGDYFGVSVSLSADGNTLAVGAQFEYSAAVGAGADQDDNLADRAGAAYVFKRAGAVWSQQSLVKASNTGTLDEFGGAVALSGDGNTLAVAAAREASAAKGVGGDQTDNSAKHSGAVYLY